MKKIIIGATGYIGKPLYLRARKSSAVCGTSTKKNNDDLVTYNLNEPNEFVDQYVERGDLIFLTAAISAPDICAKEKDRVWSINVTGTSELIRASIKRGARVIFFSSDTVYGESVDIFDERYPSNPKGEYATMKHEVEQRFLDNSAFKSLRLSYVFSRDDKFTRYLVACQKNNEVADLFHPFYRAIIHLDDVISGALALSECWEEIPEQVINFGGPQVLSRVEFAECLRDVYLHDLHFRVTQPDEVFFRNRPPFISMSSPILGKLLGRSPLNLSEAAMHEFVLPTNIDRKL
jgi:nucleoside-diphosphate-sugar epimerase